MFLRIAHELSILYNFNRWCQYLMIFLFYKKIVR
jgi:hypothetical protein